MSVIVLCFRLPNGHINFDKVWQLARQVTEFINWKQVDCPFDKNHKTKTYLQSTPVLINSGETVLQTVIQFNV